MSRDDFDIPDLGPAEPERSAPAAAPRSAPAVSASEQSGGGWFQTFLLILLVAACAGLGYFGLTIFEQQQAERKTVQQMQTQVAEMRELLNLAESSAQKNGASLKDQLSGIQESQAGKDKTQDSEIAKLWAIAHQKNTPDIARLDKNLEAQQALVAEQRKQLDVLRKKLSAQEKLYADGQTQLKTLQADLSAQADSMSAAKKETAALAAALDKLNAAFDGQEQVSPEQLAETEKKLRADINAAQTDIRLSEEAMTEEQTLLTQSLRNLTDRVAAVENGARKNGLEKRVRGNEDAVKAFDATRRELNRNLVQIKKKINALQLKLEQQAK